MGKSTISVSPEMVAVFHRLWSEGKTANQICEALTEVSGTLLVRSALEHLRKRGDFGHVPRRQTGAGGGKWDRNREEITHAEIVQRSAEVRCRWSVEERVERGLGGIIDGRRKGVS